jgi:ATP-dependent exoDNAse (exonuclease V) beta subunit
VAHALVRAASTLVSTPVLVSTPPGVETSLDTARTSACATFIMEGVIDLAFVENDEWVVVDFKTDADISGHRAQYERQLQWYAYALSRLTGLRIRASLLVGL